MEPFFVLVMEGGKGFTIFHWVIWRLLLYYGQIAELVLLIWCFNHFKKFVLQFFLFLFTILVVIVLQFLLFLYYASLLPFFKFCLHLVIFGF